MEIEDSPLIENKLQKREDETFVTPRKANKTKDSTIDRIYDYFHSDSRIELKEDEKVIMNRLEKSWLLLGRYRSRNQVARLIERLYKVSRATAYNDVANAMYIFSDPRESTKDQKRTIIGENLLQGAAYAWKIRDLKMHKEYLKEFAEINGLKDESSAEAELAKIIRELKPQQIVLNFTKEDAEREAERLRNNLTIDISHQESA